MSFSVFHTTKQKKQNTKIHIKHIKNSPHRPSVCIFRFNFYFQLVYDKRYDLHRITMFIPS